MNDRETFGWALAVIGVASIVAGAYLTGTTGEVSPLLVTGLGATTVWLALREELAHESTEGPDRDGPDPDSEAEPEGSQ